MTLARGGLVEEIARLKAASGGDIIAYGGARFVSDLIRHRLVDEFHLFVNPAALGAGLTVLTESGRTNPLRLTGSTAFDCGVVALSYVPRATPRKKGWGRVQPVTIPGGWVTTPTGAAAPVASILRATLVNYKAFGAPVPGCKTAAPARPLLAGTASTDVRDQWRRSRSCRCCRTWRSRCSCSC
jgi:hypothetical protein